MKKITIPVFSAFAGYDSQFLALRRFAKWFNRQYEGECYIEFELVGWCEIDPWAIKNHNALFPEYKHLHYNDITKVPWHKVKDFKWLIYSSCCQDISGNGKQAGLAKDSGTRSSLIWEVLDGIKDRMPKVAILENVSDLLDKSFCNEFCKWQEAVDAVGYHSCWSTLKASDFEVPQNRDRAFMVSLIDDVKQKVSFPKPHPERVKDVETFLEKEVDEKYYYSEEEAVRCIVAIHGKKPQGIDGVSIKDYGECKEQIVTPTCKCGIHRISPTLLANAGYEKVGYKNFVTTGHFPGPAVLEVWETTEDVNIPYAKYIDMANEKNDSERKVANASEKLIKKQLLELTSNRYFRLRRLTPRECFKLMGVDMCSINKLVTSGVPEAQRYKQAGNAIVVDVLVNLYKSIFNDISKW